MEQAIQLFMNLIRSELTAQPLSSKWKKSITPEVLIDLYQIASKQDQMHMLALALKKNKLLGDDQLSAVFARSLRLAFFRYEATKHTQNQIYEVFEEEEIAYVPLKGAVIRDLYPEAWMRTSCDIDILVREEDLDRAKEALISKLEYRVVKNNYHDIAMLSPNNQLLELHFKILENEEKIDRMLGRVWDYVHPVEEGKYRYEMTNEYLIFHSYAHMLYHFINGGCGMRYVIDIWILEQKLKFDEKRLSRMLKVCEMNAFVTYARKLARVWFENESHDRETNRMQMYIIEAGLFGDTETKVKARKTKTEGKGKYLFQRIFIPYKEFCASYPVLEKYPILYPYLTVKRWFKIFDSQKAEQAIQEIKLNQNMKQDSVKELRELFRKLEL